MTARVLHGEGYVAVHRRLSPNLTFYIGRQVILWVAAVFLLFVAVIFLIDLIEMLRRSAAKPDATFQIVLMMVGLRVPFLAQETVPFAVLFGSMLAFWRLNRTSELVAIRASGVSVWQFLAPAIGVAILFGALKLGALNPLAAVTFAKFEQLENRYLKGSVSLLAVSANGIWLRQADDSGQSVIYAQRVAHDRMELSNVIVILYDGLDQFAARIDADTAQLQPGRWALANARITRPDKPTETRPVYHIKTQLTLDKIQESFASPQTVSVWELPRFIKVMEATGFSALSHRLHFQSLLAEPLLLCAMVLIGAVFSLRHNRRSGMAIAIAGGIFAGFLLYFVSDLILALGQSSSIPVVLAAWTPAGASTLLGLTALLHLEDG
ncbi:MAG TPA: LPS export ABC transporter permease LptG [Alphaproteobacteria bacterium]